VIALLFLLSLPETYVHEGSQESQPFFGMLRRTKIIIIAALTLILGIGVASTSSFVSPFAQSRGIPFVSSYFLAYSGAAVVMRLLGGRFVDIVGESRVVPHALALCGMGLIMLIFVRSVPFLVLAGLVSGAAHGILFPSLSAMALRNEVSGQRAKIIAIFTGSLDAGIFVGSVALGQIGNYLGFPAIFAVAGLTFLVGLGIIFVRPVRSTP
jgi:predicted MFS family arabinose efflux permease